MLLTQILSSDTDWTKTKQLDNRQISLRYESVALLVARRTNNRKVVGSIPATVVRITVLTGNRMG